jgi:hypothetical protein
MPPMLPTHTDNAAERAIHDATRRPGVVECTLGGKR